MDNIIKILPGIQVTDSPVEEQAFLARELGLKKLFFKRDDKLPLLSHKSRSIPMMIEKYNSKKYIISSSGNAALAAALYILERNKTSTQVTLDIYTGTNIDDKKLIKLNSIAGQSGGLITVYQVINPLQKYLQAIKNPDVQGLRQSTDDTALIGYQSLAKELADISHFKEDGAVFIATSSGTTAQAIGAYFKGTDVAIYIAQTTFCHPMAKLFDRNEEDNNRVAALAPKAPAIVDVRAYRGPKVIDCVNQAGGSALIVSNREIAESIEQIKKATGEIFSGNASLSFAALRRSLSKPEIKNTLVNKTIVCLISGQ